jgi:hypothetical protein
MQTCTRENRLLPISKDLQREAPVYPAVLCSGAPWNSRVSAAKAMPFAVNFLQKQQKQRECPWDLTPR